MRVAREAWWPQAQPAGVVVAQEQQGPQAQPA